MATSGPPRAEKLIFSDKTLACSNDCAPKPIVISYSMTDANYDDDADDRTVVSCWLEGCQHPMPDTFQSTFAFTRALLHYQVDHHLYFSHFLTQVLLLDQLVYQPIFSLL